MINENTLRILNNLAFGADINSLESYIIDYKQASLMCDMYEYEYNFLKLYKILKEVKPSSVVFNDDNIIEIADLDKYDTLYKKYPNVEKVVVYGSKDIAKTRLFKNKVKMDDYDIVGIMNVRGLDIKVTYINGYIYRIYTIGKEGKYLDLTERLKHKIGKYIPEFKDYNLVELRGKLTLFNDSKKKSISLHTETSVIRCLRYNDLDDLNIVINDIYMDTDELPYDNQWDKIEYLRDIGISVPHHGLIRSVDGEILSQALNDLDDYFHDIAETNGIGYSYYGFEVRVNSDLDCSSVDSKFVYNTEDVEPEKEFESTIKSVSASLKRNGGQCLNVVRIECNNLFYIDEIEVDDIYIIEKLGLHIGKKVKFKVIENTPIIIQ